MPILDSWVKNKYNVPGMQQALKWLSFVSIALVNPAINNNVEMIFIGPYKSTFFKKDRPLSLGN